LPIVERVGTCWEELTEIFSNISFQ